MKTKSEIEALKMAIQLCKKLTQIDEDMRTHIIDDICDLDVEDLEARLVALEMVGSIL